MSFTKVEIHTVDNILKKLDSDLSDSERQSFINILLDSASTTISLLDVAGVWQALKKRLEYFK